MKVTPFAAIAGVALGFFSSCDRGEAVEPVATPSPNASILPSPLASTPPRPEGSWAPTRSPASLGVVRGGRGTSADSGAPGRAAEASADGGQERFDAAAAPPLPRPFRNDEPLESDALSTREALGVSLEAEWRYPDSAVAPRAPEQNPTGLDAARKVTALRWLIDVTSAGRLRVSFASRAFTVERGSELRARGDRLGHALVWPSGREYRVLPPGGVRTLLSERRVDAIPLVPARITGPTESQRRLGARARRWELVTRTGKLALEQVHVPQSGDGAPLLCRLLVELIAADPMAAPCASEELPVRAHYTWPQGGGIVLEATALNDRVAMGAAQFMVPPQEARFSPSRLPDSVGAFLEREELASFRFRSIDTMPDARPAEGLSAHNATDLLRFVWVDSIPVASVAPGRVETMLGLLRGRYWVQWRTFLGDSIEPVQPLDIPGRITIGLGADGGK